MAQVLEGFLLAVEARGCRPMTVESYRVRLAGLVAFLEARGLGAVGDVGPGDLDAWVVGLRRQKCRWSDHPVRTEQRGGLSPVTIRGRIQSAKALFDWCVQRGHLESSPCSHLRMPRVSTTVRCDKVMKVEDLGRMVGVAESRAVRGEPRDLAILLFLVETGCRVGELVSLRLDRLDLVGLEAVVEGKSGERVVDFTGATCGALGKWLAVRPSVDHGFVFVGRSGGPLGTYGVYGVLKRLAREGGVEGRFNPHAIRHLVGQTWTDGANLELARQKLGHEDISTTAMFYSNQDRTRLRAATRRLSLVSGEGKGTLNP